MSLSSQHESLLPGRAVRRRDPTVAVDANAAGGVNSGDDVFDGSASTTSDLVTVCDSVRDVLAALGRRVRRMSVFALVKVVFIVLLLLCGGAMQVIFLNYWLDAFPEHIQGNYTILTVSALLFSAFFLVLLATFLVTCRPDARFACQGRSLSMLFLIGLADAANSMLAIYAASHTSEVLQAIFLSLVPIYASVFTKLFLRDKRRYMNPFVVVGFTLLILGVCLASVYVFIEDGEMSEGKSSNSSSSGVKKGSGLSQKVWVLLFFVSVPLTVLMNVGQTIYMLCFTDDNPDRGNVVFVEDFIDNTSGDSQVGDADRDDDHDHDSETRARGVSARRSEGASHATFSSAAEAREPGIAPNGIRLGDDIAVKLVMLAGGTTIQALICLAWLPMDALPWYGGSDNVTEAWTNFAKGVDCLLNCPNNLLYGALYSAGFVFVYIGAAYLNQYSVTLCAMVSQLSGPVTALLLIAFPALNVTGDSAPWYVSLAAVCLLTAGTFVYVVWDEKTAAEKEAGELELKMEMHGSSERVYTRLVVDSRDE